MPLPTQAPVVDFIGQSEAVRSLDADLEFAARSDAKVLITGETGVGKEVAARIIHGRSTRASSPLVTLNCAGLQDSLLESELFGHVRGAFTGAYRDKPGLVEMAPQGTLFLDEVGEMTPRMQAVMLRFVETGEIQRVGAARPHAHVDVRLITATNRNLSAQISNGGFREDLYFRLNVIRIAVPALRERTDDIPIFVAHFMQSYSHRHKAPVGEVSTEAMDALVSYRWPGNIRELKNIVERLVLRTGGRTVRLADLPSEIVATMKAGRANGAAAAASRSHIDELVSLMVESGQSFWTAVYPKFMSRDLTRSDLRQIVQIGLERTDGRYRLLTERFNMPREDYKRFLGFLRKHDCHLPFQQFRVTPVRPARPLDTAVESIS